MLADRNASRVACAKQESRKVRWEGGKDSRRSSWDTSIALRNRRHFVHAEVCSLDVFLCLEWRRAFAAAMLQPKRRSLAEEERSGSFPEPGGEWWNGAMWLEFDHRDENREIRRPRHRSCRLGTTGSRFIFCFALWSNQIVLRFLF